MTHHENGGKLSEVKTVADEVLQRICRPEFLANVFAYGVNRIALSVKSGESEVALEISGPDHAHDEDEWTENGWMDEDDLDMDDLFEEDDEVEENGSR
jgi:hypothetical protein